MVDRLRQRFGKPILMTLNTDIHLMLNQIQTNSMRNFITDCFYNHQLPLNCKPESNFYIRLWISGWFALLFSAFDNNDTPAYVWFAFPSLQTLAELSTEEELRELGFGYRAKSIVIAAQQLINAVKVFNERITIQKSCLDHYDYVKVNSNNDPVLNVRRRQRRKKSSLNEEKTELVINNQIENNQDMLCLSPLLIVSDREDKNGQTYQSSFGAIITPDELSAYFDWLVQLSRLECQKELMQLR